MGQARDPRVERRASKESTGLRVLRLKPARGAQGGLIGFEAWDGAELVGIILYDDDLRNALEDAGLE